MKQIIKFRGISKISGRFIFGSLLLINNTAYIYEYNYGDTDDIDFGNAFQEVQIESVGQFIGLQDCHGIDIYAGDIIKERGWKIPAGIVEFGKIGYDWEACGLTGFVLHSWGNDGFYNLDFDFDYTKYEIIGNIYQEKTKEINNVH